MNANQMFTESISEKEKFWTEQAENIEWFKKPTKILTDDGTITQPGLKTEN